MNIAPVPYCYSVERDDWISVYRDFPATHILTLHFEPEFGGKVCPVERTSPETGEILTIAPSSHWRPESKSLPSSVAISMHVAQRVMYHFWNHVDRKIFGSHYHNRSLDRRSQFLGVAENLGTNFHLHIKFFVPEGRTDRFTAIVAQDIWDKVWGRGRVCMQDIRDDTEAWGIYVTKNLMYDEEWCDADRIVYSPSLNRI